MRCRQSTHLRTPVAALAAFVVTAVLPSAPVRGQSEPDGEDPHANLPLTMQLTGVVRDFRERSVSGGHPDFERRPSGGFGHYQYIVADQLDADNKPVFLSTGRKVTTQWRDGEGRNIIAPRSYLMPLPGDRSGAMSNTDGGAVTTAANFSQWFRDTPGASTSAPLSITLTREPGSPLYTFDDTLDPEYDARGGFFPIDDELFGNTSGENHNYHFTYELAMNFVYKRGEGQVFTFTGDDDVWVYVDNRLVIDLGGVHSAVSQTIDLDRCEWLQHNQRYTLRFFFVERHRTQSNFRIDTTISLSPAQLPTVSALFD